MSAVGPYLDTVPALNAILQYQQGILSALQNLQVYVTGITLTTIDTGYVGVGILNSQVTLPITGVVGGVVSIGNVPTVLVNTGYVGVNVLNTPNVSVVSIPAIVVNTGYVGVSVLNTPSVNVANTPNVNVANTPTVNVGTTVNVNIVGSAIQVPVQLQSTLVTLPITGVVGGTVSIGNTPSVVVNTGYVGASIVNTPNVNVANTPTVVVGSTVNVSVVNTPNVNIANTPTVNVGNQPTVTVGNTVNVTVVNTPNVNVANTPNVNVANTPTVLVGSTVNATIVGSAIQVPVSIQSAFANVPITGIVANAGAYTGLDRVVYSNTTFYTASPPSTTYSSAINVVPYESASVLFNVTSLQGTGVTVSLNAYFPGLGINYTLASQTLTSPGQALLTASVLPFNYITLGVTIYGSTVVLSAELVAKP